MATGIADCRGSRGGPVAYDLPLSARRDVLVFQTAPLEEAAFVAGLGHCDCGCQHPRGTRISQRSCYTFTRLARIKPDGYYMRLADRIVFVTLMKNRPPLRGAARGGLSFASAGYGGPRYSPVHLIH